MKAGKREIKVVKITSDEYRDLQEAIEIFDNFISCIKEVFGNGFSFNDIPELIDDSFSVWIEDEEKN